LTSKDLVRRTNQTYLHVVGKGSRERFVPLMPNLFRRLERYALSRPGNSYSDRIFLSLTPRASGELEPLTPEGVCDVIKKSAERAGITRRVYTHLMRHSFFTNALRAEMNPIVLAQIGGHANLKMIQTVYSHLDTNDAYTAMSRIMAKERDRF
jgi:site-specific recombinase XerD